MIINSFCSWKRVICFLFPVIDRRVSCIKVFGLLSRAMEELWWPCLGGAQQPSVLASLRAPFGSPNSGGRWLKGD